MNRREGGRKKKREGKNEGKRREQMKYWEGTIAK